MAYVIHHQDGPVLRIETDVIDITTLPRSIPDPAWTHRDTKGHLHGMIDGEYVTLKTKRMTRYYEDGETWIETRYYCRRCGRRVEPGTMIDPKSLGRQFMQGLTHYYVDDREVTKEEAEAVMNGLRP